MNDLRAEALRLAADDSRTNMGGQTFNATPEVIVQRAKVYLAFLLGTPDKTPTPHTKAKLNRKPYNSR
jgi:ubiquitin